MSDDLLIVGLGNPGIKYDDTRHNVGFMAVDELARSWRLDSFSSKWKSLYSRGKFSGTTIVLLKPQTFMNRSGQAVVEAVNFFKIPMDNVIVIHDDLDMHPGRLKLVKGGGAGGHNGIRSMVQHLGDNSFYRLKIGIGRPGKLDVHPDIPVENYVLSALGSDEQRIFDDNQPAIQEGLQLFVDKGPSRAMSFINSIK